MKRSAAEPARCFWIGCPRDGTVHCAECERFYCEEHAKHSPDDPRIAPAPVEACG